MTQILVMAAVAAPFVIAPGASLSLTIAHTHLGRHAWLPVAAGTWLGLVVIALALGATGFADAISEDNTLRRAIGAAGSIILIGIGVCTLIRASRRQASPAPPVKPLRLGLVASATVITNPKAIALYAVVVPATDGTTWSGPALYTAFTLIHGGLMSLWLGLVHWVTTRARSMVTDPRPRRVLVALAGGAMITLGIAAGLQAALT